MELMLGFVVAMSVTMVLIPPLMRLAGRVGVLDQPGARRIHVNPTPRVGGIAMAAGVLLALALWGHFDRAMQAYFAGLSVLAVFGVWDDRAELGAGAKFLGQAIAVLLAMLWGGVRVVAITGAERLPLPEWVSAPLSFLFLIGATNAVNLADGLDGLAGGMSLLCLAALALLALTVGNPFVGMVALVIAGATLGFLRYNTHPARVFMGDCGSQILGYSAAVLSVSLTQDPQAPLSAALPLLLLGVPVIDTLVVMTQRMLAGASPFRADRNHVHHRLLALGFDHHEAVMVLYGLQGCLFVAAWFMRYQSDLVILLLFLVFGTAMIGTLSLAAARGWRWRRPQSGELPPSALSRQLAWLRQPQRLPRWSAIATAAAVLGYAAVVLLRLPASSELRPLLAAVAAVLGLNLALRWRSDAPNWIDRGGLYLGAVLGVYIEVHSVRIDFSLHEIKAVLVGVLALAVAARMWAARDRQFRINPLDLLVIFAALAVPNLPGSVATPQGMGSSIAKLVLLLYGLESLAAGAGARWRWFSLASLLFLLLCLAGSMPS
jgi:UDP-GlcNAc:undecaprenyl-phosphate GlcNAc-1-phosphate transferase